MRLYELLQQEKITNIPDCDVKKITDDTREIEVGDIFVCIKGENFDGHSQALAIEEKGACLIVAEHDTGAQKQLIVDNSRLFFAELASRFYGNPTQKLKLIAATGTNGKSTVINLIKFVLNETGHKTGSIGTIGYDVCGKTYEAHLTTPRQMDLYRYFAEMVENGAEYCVMEASSLALVQNRFAGERFVCSVFTNLTQDHLDYHRTMENYYKAKRLLFDMSDKAVVCADDEYGMRLSQEIDIPCVMYSVNEPADYYAVNIKSNRSHVSYWLSSLEDEKSFPIKFKMPGTFNVANSMAAVAVCTELGIGINDCVEAIQKCKGVCGRCEVVWDGDFTVICDYAHTTDALEKTLSSIRSFAEKRVICVFGAAGERDAKKRKSMGEAAARLSDYVVLTSDNPRFENPQKIIEQVEAGMKKSTTPYSTFVDRYDAIEFALNEAENGDIVALCGKGHETYQVIGDDYQEFDEHKIVKNIMSAKEKH